MENEIIFNEDNRIKEEILTKPDYMNWLFRFTEVYPRFVDDTWLYQPSKLSPMDRENVDKLHLLFNIIKEYADANYIDSKGGQYDEYYTIKCNNYGYDIGKISRMVGDVFVCQRTILEEEYIDFNDIINHREYSKTNEINKELRLLKETIINLQDMGVSHKLIWKYLNSIMNESRKENGNRLVKKK